MRIWDIPCYKLCRQHLLGEHRELHAIWNILTQNKKGYKNHPEVKRWLKVDYEEVLTNRHSEEAIEMLKRGYKHKSPLNPKIISGCFGGFTREIPQWQSTEEQIKILKKKGCKCKI